MTFLTVWKVRYKSSFTDWKQITATACLFVMKRRSMGLCGGRPADVSLEWGETGARGGERRDFHGDELWQVLDNDGNKREFWSQHFKKKKTSLPFAILCEPCLIHRWVFLPLPPSTLNCCFLNSLFFLLIPPVFSVSLPCPCLSPLTPFTVILLKWVSQSAISLVLNSLGSGSHLPSSSFPWLCAPLRWDIRTWFFWGGAQSSRTEWLKLPMKSMFNSDDCRPLTGKKKKKGRLSSIKRQKNKGIEGDAGRALMGFMELSSVGCLVMRRNHPLPFVVTSPHPALVCREQDYKSFLLHLLSSFLYLHNFTWKAS